MSSKAKKGNLEIKEWEYHDLEKVKTNLKRKEKFFGYLFVFLLFLVIASFFYSQIQKDKINESFYYGKYATYYKALDNGKERWFYSFNWKGKRIDVPLYNKPQDFENLNFTTLNKPKLNRNVVLVFYEDDNLSVITASVFNLARVLIPFGYFKGKNLFISYYKNNSVDVLNSSLGVIAKGPLVCNSSLTTFIVLNASIENKSSIVFNGSCIFLNGKNKELLKAVDLFDVLLTRKYNIK
jgi:hypothetical protein